MGELKQIKTPVASLTRSLPAAVSDSLLTAVLTLELTHYGALIGHQAPGGH